MKNKVREAHKKRVKEQKDKGKRVESAYPKGWKKPKTMRLLTDWQAMTRTVMDDKKHGHVVEYILSPKGRVYRRAFSWENPSLYIDSPLFRENVRLIRISDKKVIKEVKRALRRDRSR